MTMPLFRPRPGVFTRRSDGELTARIAEPEQEIHRLKSMQLLDVPGAVRIGRRHGTVRKIEQVYAWVELGGRLATVAWEDIAIVLPEQPKKKGKP